jgi:hypothetical protein
MRLQRGGADWNQLLEDLEKLQRTWEARAAKVVEPDLRLRAHGVVLGIETGRRSIAELKPSSPAKLNALLNLWEGIANRKASGPAVESIEGIDFGIHLVVSRVRRNLNRLVRPKPPTSEGRGKGPWRSQA